MLFKTQKSNNNNSSSDTLISLECVIITNPYFIYAALHFPDKYSLDSCWAPKEPYTCANSPGYHILILCLGISFLTIPI